MQNGVCISPTDPMLNNCLQNQPQPSSNAQQTQIKKQTPLPIRLVVVEKRGVHSNN